MSIQKSGAQKHGRILKNYIQINQQPVHNVVHNAYEFLGEKGPIVDEFSAEKWYTYNAKEFELDLLRTASDVNQICSCFFLINGPS